MGTTVTSTHPRGRHWVLDKIISPQLLKISAQTQARPMPGCRAIQRPGLSVSKFNPVLTQRITDTQADLQYLEITQDLGGKTVLNLKQMRQLTWGLDLKCPRNIYMYFYHRPKKKKKSTFSGKPHTQEADTTATLTIKVYIMKINKGTPHQSGVRRLRGGALPLIIL